MNIEVLFVWLLGLAASIIGILIVLKVYLRRRYVDEGLTEMGVGIIITTFGVLILVFGTGSELSDTQAFSAVWISGCFLFLAILLMIAEQLPRDLKSLRRLLQRRK